MSKKVTILHIITRLDMGGSAQNTLLTVLNLDCLRFRVVLIKGPTGESFMTNSEIDTLNQHLGVAREKRVEVIELPWLVRRISPWNDLKSLVCLLRILRRSKPHIVHTHTSKAGVLGRLAAWLARVPIIIHTSHGHVFYGHFPPRLSRWFLRVERLLDRITHHQIALTPGEARDYQTLRVFRPNKTSVIPSGVDLRRFSAEQDHRLCNRKTLGLPNEAPVVGFVGWLLPIKGVTYLVQAMAGVVRRHPHSLLVLVGKGEEEGRLRCQAEALGIGPKVRFLGWRSDVERIMSCFDLLVLPSLNEGMGRVLVEGMAMGLPIVASRVGGIPDLVVHEKNGLLVQSADAAALEVAISGLLQDKARRRRMGEAGRRQCRAFSTEMMLAQLINLYAMLLEQHTVGGLGFSGPIFA